VGALVNSARAKGLDVIAVGIGSAGASMTRKSPSKPRPTSLMLENYPSGNTSVKW